MKKEKILVFTPTTARRLPLLKEILKSIYDNTEFDVKTIVVKNGTFPNKEYYDFEFGLPNVVKEESSPGGHLSKALNVGLNHITDEDWVLFIEDDFMITEKDWLRKCVDTFNSIKNCGTLGARLHGTQRNNKYPNIFKQKDWDTFEVVWSDGITLYKGDIMREHNVRFDENFIAAGDMCDVSHILSDLGYENWRLPLENQHFHIGGDRAGTDKWKYAEVEADMSNCNANLYLKWKDSDNEKIKWWIENDTKEEQEYLNEKSHRHMFYK